VTAPTPDGQRPAVSALAAGFRIVIEAFEDEIGRPPGVVELLDILCYGAQTLPDDALVDAHPDEIVGFAEQPPATSRDTDAVSDLNDNAFSEASSAFNAWWETGTGAPITVAELGAAVLGALQECGPALRDEPDAARLTSVTLKRERAKARARAGDVIAVPAGDDAYHLVVLVFRGRFGTAFGLLRGRYGSPTPPPDLSGAATGVAVYSDDEGIAAGRWPIVGHNDGLLALFPAEPERYHQPQPTFPGLPPIGPFGAAETLDGRLRDVSEEESRRVGLLEDSFQQTYHSSILGRVLPDLLARPG